MRCIDADALRDRLQNLGYDDWNQGATTTWAEAFSECADMVEEMPTIEPRCETCEAFNKTRLLIPQPERKKGMWIEHNPHKWGLGIVFECSECGEKIDCEPSNFCPNCGADMREDAEEPKKCDTCLHEKEPWSMQCHRCEDYNLWEEKQ